MCKRIIALPLIGAALMCVGYAISPNITEAQILFNAKIDYGVGNGPRSVAICDLNGDGVGRVKGSSLRLAVV